MDKLTLILLIVAGVIGIALWNNQVMFAFVVVIVAFVALIIYLYMMREHHIDPLEEFKKNLLNECFNPENRLGFLKLSGGIENEINHQIRTLGKIKGYTKITIKPVNPKYTKLNPWNTFYIIVYNPQGSGFIAKLKNLLFSLPFLDGFKRIGFFAVNPAQLKGNDITFGDIIIKGTAMTTISIFETLNCNDLDRDYVMNFLGKETQRIVFSNFLRKTATLVDNAIESDAAHQKILDIVGSREQPPQQPPTYGIKMP